MEQLRFLLLISLILCGCNSYENKDKYELKVGETVSIYYSTNSCCDYRLSNKKDLKHIQLVRRKSIDSGFKDCAGCNYTAAFIFKALSVGIDTVELKLLGDTMNAVNDNTKPEKYIIEIK